MAVLSDDEVRQQLEGLDGWSLEGASIVRELRFSDFPEAVAFVVHLAFAAEAADHHPDLDIRYNRLTVRLSTHSEGGITHKDIELAEAIDRLAPQGVS